MPADSARFAPVRMLRSSSVRVWLAEDRVAGGAVVVKAARPGTQAARERLLEGARLSRLRHPWLIGFVDFAHDVPDLAGDPGTGFVTRWVDGEPLGAELVELPLAVRLGAFSRAVAVAAWLHRRGWLHLDLKPANLLATGSELRVLDLGSARPVAEGPGASGGTPGYAAPEVVLGEAPSEAADVYGLGAVLYELLAGRVAHDLSGRETLREQVLRRPPLPLRAVAPEVPRPLAELVGGMLAPSAAERPTVEEVAGVVGRHEIDGEGPLVGQDQLVAAIDGLLRQKDVGHVAVHGPGAERVLRRVLAEAAVRGRRTLDATELQLAGHRLDPSLVLLREADRPFVRTLLDEGHVVLEACTEPVGAAVQLRTVALRQADVEVLGRFHGVSDGARLEEVLRLSLGRPDRAVALLRGEESDGGPTPSASEALHRLEGAGPRVPVEDLLPLAAVVGGDVGRLWRARLLVRAGRMADAREAFRGLELAPDDRLLAARACRRAGAFDEAEGWLERSESPTTEHVRLALARRRLDPALDLAVRLRAVDPGPEALLVRLLVALHRLRGGLEDAPGPLLAAVDEHAASGVAGSALLSAAGRLCAQVGELRRGHDLLGAAAEAADREGDSTRSAAVRLNLGNQLLAAGDGVAARRAYTRARLIAEAAGASDLALRVVFSLADLELRAGRLPAAEQRIAEFHRLPLDEEGRARGRLLRARLCAMRDEHGAALAVLDQPGGALPREEAELVRVHALLALGRTGDARELLATGAEPSDPWVRLQREAARGRALLLEGREVLRTVRAELGAVDPGPARRHETGAVLLATAGEDLDPDGFAERRADLHQAATLLRGHGAARAAALRDQLVDRPGASLDEVARLLESLEDPLRFPQALARLVKTSLGAHRVLIMVRLPGLGRQLGYQELSGEEAAGIALEVLEHIQTPDDVWIAEDAFADAHLREVSATVRTFELKSLLAVGIPWRGRTIGALYVDDLHRAGRFGDEDVRLLQRVARATGHLLTLAGPSPGPGLDEPRDVCGVMLPADQHEPFRRAVDALAGRRESNLLITGETGAGKTWFVRRLATDVLGLRGVEELVLRQGDVKMLVGQLAGIKRGDYTGAVDRPGAIARALRGRRLLFLDEIQALDHEAQQTLLPLLDMPERRLGGLGESLSPLAGPLHIALGTNAPVERGAWRKLFREDFWYRISSTRLHLPSLAERGPEVVYVHLRRFLADAGASAPEDVLEPAALRWATSASWPGNLRELRAWAQDVAAQAASVGRRLKRDELKGATRAPVPLRRWDADAKVQRVLAALRRARWVQAEAARDLGMDKANLHRFLRLHGLVDEVREQAKAQKELDAAEP